MSQEPVDPRPFWVRWQARDWAFFLLQMFLGLLFLSLAFGQMLIGGHTTVADIAIHLGLTVGALMLVEEEKK